VFNGAVEAVVNPSDAKGGTLKLAQTDDWDSPDPGDTSSPVSTPVR
jgi:peptide/nickel transport system substrate-binding protein